MGRGSFRFSFILAKAFRNYLPVHEYLGEEPKLWIILVFMDLIFIYWDTLKKLTSDLRQQRAPIGLEACNRVVPYGISWHIELELLELLLHLKP